MTFRLESPDYSWYRPDSRHANRVINLALQPPHVAVPQPELQSAVFTACTRQAQGGIVERPEAEEIYDAGREAAVEALLRMDRQIQTLSERLLPYARRAARDRRLGAQAKDHVSHYRAIMRSDVARGPEAAVGSTTHESWLAKRQLQFDDLLGIT